MHIFAAFYCHIAFMSMLMNMLHHLYFTSYVIHHRPTSVLASDVRSRFCRSLTNGKGHFTILRPDRFVYIIKATHKNMYVLPLRATSCHQHLRMHVSVNILWGWHCSHSLSLLLIKPAPRRTVSCSAFIGTWQYRPVFANFLSWGR